MVPILIDEIKTYAKVNHVPIMQEDGINFLVDYIKKHNIKNILEIGTAIGYSAIMMASVNENIRITTIERDNTMYQEAIKNITECNLNNQIEIINKDALTVEISGKYDLIFIDAAKSQYINFFNKYSTNLDDSGVIITDNLKFHGLVNNSSTITNRNTRQLVRKIEKYIDFLKNNEIYQTEFLDIGDGISITRKK